MKTSKLTTTERVGAWIATGGVGLCLWAGILFVFAYGFVDMSGSFGWFLVQLLFTGFRLIMVGVTVLFVAVVISMVCACD